MNIARINLATLTAVGILVSSCQTAATKKSDTITPTAPSSNTLAASQALVHAEEVETNWIGTSSIPALRSASERGDALAEAIFGYLLLHGMRVPQNVEQGLSLLEKSADQGFSHAMAELGDMYLNGSFVPQDYGKAFQWLNRAADKDEAGAEWDLGMCYAKGRSVATNFTTAITWFRRAADQTNYAAMKELGVIYMNGTGVPKDNEQAKFWLTRAANEGNHAHAMYDLGVLGQNGALGTNSLVEGYKWYKRSAELHDPMGCWALAVCYRYGKGVKPDSDSYFFWMCEAAERGVPEAQDFLGNAYRLGDGVPTNRNQAMKWYRNAATNNFPDACYNLAVENLEDKTNEAARAEANSYMMQAAQLEHREAQFQYAWASLQGTFAPKDIEQWKKWLTRAAEGGWPKAEFILSQALMSGWVPFTKDEAEGQKWLERAAKHGDFEAQCKLAIRLMTGFGVAKNPAEAIKWWRWAAEHGFPQAQNDLGYAIETGDSSKADLVEACMWFQLAAKGGVAPAKVNLKNILGSLMAQQADEATRRAGDFRAQPMPALNPMKRENDIGTPSLNMSNDQ